jgi:magnesium transporter
MGKEFVIAKSHWTFKECIKEFRKQAAEFDDIYTVYVTDNNEKLLGTLSLKKLLISPTQSKVEEFYNSDVQFVKSTDNAEEVAYKMEKYDLIALPVLDDLYRLIGRITIDDVVDFIKEEADKDYQMASGITDDIDTNDSIWDITKARIPWLLIGMVGGLLGAQVIKYFEIGEGGAGQMAMFIPLIAAMGGNVGVQSSAIIVQGLANNSLANTKIIAKLSKEIGVAFLNGFICSVVLLIYGYIFIGQIDASIAISLSLFTVICVAAVFGTLIPLMLDKYKIDPALATGPFITTLNDVVGLAIYFTIGGLIIG